MAGEPDAWYGNYRQTAAPCGASVVGRARGRGAAPPGGGGFIGPGAGQEEKKPRRRPDMAFKFEDDEDSLPAGYVNPMSQTSGTDKDIAPARRTDDGWDPRQW